MKLKRFDDKSENIMKYKNAKSRKILVRGILQSQLVPFNIAFGISFPNPPSKYFKDEWNRNGLEQEVSVSDIECQQSGLKMLNLNE